MPIYKEIQALLEEVSCEPYRIQFNCINCVRGDFRNGSCGSGHGNTGHVWYLQASLFRRDTDTNEHDWGYGGKYFITQHMTPGEIVKKAFVACRDYSEHEVREAFMYKGRRILGPHIDIEALWTVAGELEVRN